MATSRGRNWVLTIFKTADGSDVTADTRLLNLDGARFFRYSVEQCPQTGRMHCQAMVSYDMVRRFAWVKDHTPEGTHIELMRGSFKSNMDYTSKDATHIAGPFDFGDCPTSQGHRSDLDEVAQAVIAGQPIVQIAREHPVAYIRNTRGIGALRHVVDQSPEWRTVVVEWYWGDKGFGKSKIIHDTYPDVFEVPSEDASWFDGYDRQDAIIFEEFSGRPPINWMKKLLDGYRRQLPIKGGFIWAHWTRVFITSNVDPATVYLNETAKDRAAFFRRIGTIYHLEKPVFPELLAASNPGSVPEPYVEPVLVAQVDK